MIVDEERLNAVRIFMRNFYAPLKTSDPTCGLCSSPALLKIFTTEHFQRTEQSENISMMPEYSAICGISQSEIETQMTDEVKAMGQTFGTDLRADTRPAKSNYDGYHFSYQSEGHLQSFQPHQCPKRQDVQQLLVQHGHTHLPHQSVEKYDTDLTSIDGSETEAADFDAPTEGMVSVLAHPLSKRLPHHQTLRPQHGTLHAWIPESGGKIWTDALTDALLSGTWHRSHWRKGRKNEPQP